MKRRQVHFNDDDSYFEQTAGKAKRIRINADKSPQNGTIHPFLLSEPQKLIMDDLWLVCDVSNGFSTLIDAKCNTITLMEVSPDHPTVPFTLCSTQPGPVLAYFDDFARLLLWNVPKFMKNTPFANPCTVLLEKITINYDLVQIDGRCGNGQITVRARKTATAPFIALFQLRYSLTSWMLVMDSGIQEIETLAQFRLERR